MHKESSWTIDRLRSFAPLPFKQGVLVELQQPNKPGDNLPNSVVLCVLQDFQRTSNFLFYLTGIGFFLLTENQTAIVQVISIRYFHVFFFTDSPLPASCEVEFTVPQYCNSSIKDILKSSKDHKEDDSIGLLALFSSALLKLSAETVKLKVASLIVTSSALVVTQDKVHWLLPGNNKLPTIVAEQGMSNLIEVVNSNPLHELFMTHLLIPGDWSFVKENMNTFCTRLRD